MLYAVVRNRDCAIMSWHYEIIDAFNKATPLNQRKAGAYVVWSVKV